MGNGHGIQGSTRKNGWQDRSLPDTSCARSIPLPGTSCVGALVERDPKWNRAWQALLQACRDFPQFRYRKPGRVGLFQGARQPGRCAAPGADVLRIAVECSQHGPDQRVGVEAPAGQGLLDPDHLAGNRLGQVPVP